jgi:hypothetical protein
LIRRIPDAIACTMRTVSGGFERRPGGQPGAGVGGCAGPTSTSPGKRTLTGEIVASSPAPVQRKADSAVQGDPAELHHAAQSGISGPGQAMPHADKIQAAFGADHDVSSIRAHVGGPATTAPEPTTPPTRPGPSA